MSQIDFEMDGQIDICVKFDNGSHLYVDEEVLDFEIPPATDQEVNEAIRSILGK